MKSGHRLSAALLGAAVVLGLGSGSAQASQIVFLQLTGGVQGPILGDSAIIQQAGRIEVQEIHHLIHRDPGTGRLVNEPFIFLKSVDRSTVNLHRALDTSESLTAAFRYYRSDQQGQTINYYTVTLLNAVIVAIEPVTRDAMDPASAFLPDRERVRMTYERIRVEYPSDGGEQYEITAN